MKAKTGWRWLSLIVVMTMLLAMVPGFASAQEPIISEQGTAGAAKQEPDRKEARPEAPQALPQIAAPRKVSMDQYLTKLHPDLRELAQTAGPALPPGNGPQAGGAQEPILIQIIADVGRTVQPFNPAKVGQVEKGQEPGIDWSPYFVDGKFFARPVMEFGEQKIQFIVGSVLPSNLLKIASLGHVQSILPMKLEQTGYPEDYPADDPRQIPERGPSDWAALRADADKLREGSLPWDQARAFGDGREQVLPYDWFEVMPEGPHKAEAAWDRGYTGEGVTVAVMDDGIDPAHPDLIGTQKIYSSTVATAYNGWPMVFSPFSQYLYFLDDYYGDTYIADGYYSSHYVDTSNTPALTPCGAGISCFSYRPLIDVGVPGLLHTYVISNAMTQSGVVHVGTHPDFDLRDFVWGEKVAVLVADPNVAGVYDTVYVDLDDDYDFRDEKPLTRADVNDPGTYNDMIAYRDMDGDGLADLSGGMVYFVADGVTPIPASDVMWYPFIPGNGDLVAFSGGTFDRAYSHGTQCASNVVGQGVVDGMLPEFRDLAGTPPGAVYGMAPNAKMVNVSDIYYNFDVSKLDAYYFAAMGYDGIPSAYVGLDTDAIQITSNSYGASDEDNDGWDFDGQVVSQVQRWAAPFTQYLFSTGNGAPAYGTSSPPSPATGIAVGASTEFGSTGWDSITDTHQIMNNDVTPFSNRGPGARDSAGVDVVAGGAFAAGDEELNYYAISTWGVLDGNLSWDSWGGTSRSGPVTMGVLALIYDAYYQANGWWPDYDTAKALLMSSATDLNYDTFTQGGGSANADRGTAVAGGHYGVYVTKPTWTPGDYNGNDWPGFAHVVYPGETWTETFTVTNDSAAAIDVVVSDTYLELIDDVEFDFTVTAAQAAAEQDNFHKAFNYWIPITATAGMDDAWYNIDVPPDTDLMIVRQMFPYDEYDDDGDYSWDNRFYLAVYNWQDEDSDGIVWDDKDSNGVVNFANSPIISQIDGGQEPLWDDPITELDRWEYGRFSYNRPGGNRNEMWVHDPLERMIDGLFIGLYHHPDSTYTGDTHLKYRIDFYKKVDVPWLSTDAVNPVNVPAGGTANFTGTVNVPGDIPTGKYEAAIEVYDAGSGPDYEANTTVIPVVLAVAEKFSEGMTLGGTEAYNYDALRPYNNGAVRGMFDWTWRAESGDWRFFYTDLENCEFTPVYEEDFESDDGGYVPGGTNSSWEWGAPTSGPGAAHSGSNVWATDLDDDYNTDEDSYLELALDLSAYAGSEMLLDWWEYADVETDWDGWYADVSNDGGATWTELQAWTGSTGGYWNPTYTLDPSYAVSNFRLRFGLISDFMIEYPGLYVDDVTISPLACTYGSDTTFLIKDEWADAAPHTDLDTVVLGPTPTLLGTGWHDGWYEVPEPDFYGPYTLEPVASSPNTNIGDGTWLFNTSSGANEDWITAPLPVWTPDKGGLHEILNHNVLFEGLTFDVVFTKTLGTLWEDEHAFAIETYVDAGLVGTVTLESSLDLNGLVADGFLLAPETMQWVNEPLDFVDSNTNEWTYEFSVADGVDIELWTSSPDISDIDLFLYYWNGTSWEQRGSSETGSANEYIYVAAPEDGQWMVGVNNWSGPAGHFNLDLVVRGQVGGLNVTGLPLGAVPAYTPVPLTIHYDYPLEPETCYGGLLFVGPPEAPNLKEIEIEICRLPESARVDKSVNHEVSFPGHELDYTIGLFNLTDPDAYFEFSDPIPENTEFVTVTGTCCHDVPLLFEGFEDSWLPAGWNEYQLGGATVGWERTTAGDHISLNPHSGSYMAWHDDEMASCDSWLVSPQISVPASGASLRFFQAVGWGTYYTYHGVLVTTDADPDPSTASYTQLWSGNATSSWTEQVIDLGAYASQDIYLAFNYQGNWSSEWYLDDVQVDTSECTDAWYDDVSDAVLYADPLSLSDFTPPAPPAALEQGFEDNLMPPPSWDQDPGIGTYGGWVVLDAATYPDWVHSGDYFAWANYSEDDTWLYSPWVEVTAGDAELSFWAYSSTDNTGGTVTVYVIDQFGGMTPIWDMVTDEVWSGFDHRQVVLDLSAFEGAPIQVAWQYWLTGAPNISSFGLDDIVVPGVPTELAIPTCEIDLTVLISDTAQPDSWITNTATLTASHFMVEVQDEAPVSAEAYTQIGSEEFLTSYKDASETVHPGDTITYEVHVINSGDELAFVELTDPIPDGTTYAGHDNNPPYQHFVYSDTLDAMLWEGNVASDEEWVFSFEVTADETLVSGDKVTNTATMAWDSYTLDLEATTDIIAPVLHITKTVDLVHQNPGKSLEYTIVFWNDGTDDAASVVISDVLPAEVEFIEAEPAGSYYSATHELVWGPMTLTVGSAVTATVPVTIGAEVTPCTWMTNTVYLFYDDMEPLMAEVSHHAHPPCVLVDGADFDWSPDAPVEGDTVYLTGTVTAGDLPITYTWDFGDGGTAAGIAPSHVYTPDGAYTVWMTATNCAGTGQSVISHTLTVGAKPPPSLTVYLPIILMNVP